MIVHYIGLILIYHMTHFRLKGYANMKRQFRPILCKIYYFSIKTIRAYRLTM